MLRRSDLNTMRLKRARMLDALLDAFDGIRRLVLLHVAVSHARFVGCVDDRLHIDRTIAQFLESVLGNASKIREGHAFFDVLEMELRNAPFELFYELHRVCAANDYPEDVHFEFHLGRELLYEDVVAYLAAFLRLEFECVIVIGELNAGWFG